MKRSVREEAADLLACLASQPSLIWEIGTDPSNGLPGDWSYEARTLAWRTLSTPDTEDEDGWREMYAEAEARLRGGES